jgi:3-phosphoshikimate 1-carboxyvinyltransferase
VVDDERQLGRERSLGPGAPLVGRLSPPASKSILQRALVAAAVSRGVTRIAADGGDEHGAWGDDVAAAIGFVSRWTGHTPRLGSGAGTEARTELIEVQGRPEGPAAHVRAFEVAESGTLARLVTALLALRAHGPARSVVPGGSLRARRSPALFEALERAGARLTVERAGGWPVEVAPAESPARWLGLIGPDSSQELTALWMAAAAGASAVEVRVEGEVPSRPYLDLTRAVLERFGARVLPLEGGGPFDTRVTGPMRAPRETLVVEPDASAAAVALAAGCLSGGSIRVPGLGLDSVQGDMRVLEHLTAFGCRTELDVEGCSAAGRPSRPARLCLADTPDLAPVLAAVAGAVALADPVAGPSLLEGLETLPRKESSRIEVLTGGLRALGVAVQADSRSMTIGGTPRRGGLARAADSVRLDPAGDHRMAFAFALLSLVRPGVVVLDGDCTRKSWPGFFDALARLRGGAPSG